MTEDAAPQKTVKTAADVVRCLNNRFAAPEWAFAVELSLIPGFIRGRRADAVALNCWSSGKWGLSFLGFEIKVSRGDFLHELKHPHKRRETYPDVDGIFFATPKGLVLKSEVPADCGLIECWANDGADMTRIQKYPEGFKTAMDHMFSDATVNLHMAPPISRAVSVAMIRGFDPDRINQETHREAATAKYELRNLRSDMRYKERRIEELEAIVRNMPSTEKP